LALSVFHKTYPSLTLNASGKFWAFRTKQPNRMWLCTCITRVPKVVESCSKAQKTWQVV